MPADPIAIVSITISLITTLGGILLSLHLKKCHSLCCDSECTKTPPATPNAFEMPIFLKEQPKLIRQSDI